MGKHERQLIEKAEKIIVKILKAKKLNDSDKKNHWINHAIAIAKELRKDFKKIDSVKHLGNRYDNTGDISLISKGKKFFLEIKMSDKKAGIGTMANISQNALTDNYLFEGNIESWSEFRENKKHDIWVNNFLDRYNNYPKIITRIRNTVKKKEEKARYLRELSKKGNKKAKTILDSIQKKDKEEKIDYLCYLNAQKQRTEIIKRFFILTALGIHNQKIVNDLINNKEVLKETQNLIVYYANIYKGNIVTKKENVGERVAKIIKKYSKFKIIFPKDLTHCKIIGIRGKISESLLQIVFHWKNIAQGIKTPCLNIFDLTNKID